MLGALEQFTVQLFNRYIDEQCETVRRAAKDASALKKPGALPSFRRLPNFVDHMEVVLARAADSVRSTDPTTNKSSANANDSTDASMLDSMVTNAYHKLAVHLFRTLESIEVDGKRRYLVRLENYHHFVQQFGKTSRNVKALASYVEQANERLLKNSEQFCDFLLRKEFGPFCDFFTGVEQMLERYTFHFFFFFIFHF